MKSEKSLENISLVTNNYNVIRYIPDEKEEMYEELLHCATFEIKQPENTILVTDYFFELTGYEQTSPTFSLKNIIHLVHPEDLMKIVPQIIDFSSDKESEIEIYYRIFINGEPKYRLFKARKVKPNKTNNTYKIIGIVQDVNYAKITEAKLEQERSQLRTLIDNLPDFIYIKDNKSNFIIANQKLAAVTKAISPDEMIGKNDFFYYPEDLANKFYNDELHIFKTGEALINHIEPGLDENEEFIWVSTTKVPIKNKENNIIGLVGIGRDITNLKKSEEKMKQYSDNLKNLNESKDRFFSILAHDLRNPVSNMLGLSDLLLKNLQRNKKEKVEQMAILLNNTTYQIYALIENLLEWSRNQLGTTRCYPSDFDVIEPINDTIDLLENIAGTKKIKIIPPVLPGSAMVNADINMVQTILRNIIGNALKFTEPDGRIVIDIFDQNKEYEISISDTGIGIEPQQLNRIFIEDSKNLVPGTQGEKGTGLGLIICKDFIEKNNGTIRVESKIGEGTTFRFTLPKSKNEIID